MGYYHRWEDFPERGVYYLPGMEIRVRIMSGEKIMLTDIKAKKGVHIDMHHHEPEQMILIHKGQMKVRTGKDAPKVLGPGDIWVVPSNCPARCGLHRGYGSSGNCQSPPPGQFRWFYRLPYLL